MCRCIRPAVPRRERDLRLQSSSEAPLTPSAGLGDTRRTSSLWRPVPGQGVGIGWARTVVKGLKAYQDLMLMRKVGSWSRPTSGLSGNGEHSSCYGYDLDTRADPEPNARDKAA
jgi:hypothetical protein